ncbi:hypothetical protein M9Y10_045009 [Tritrichomonas musculus]|uniref:Uncharacterized protein n=1 Tax=Tritrichomonas musculus TaxID=1915356 RepID=A0ABR2JU19_9EUKA
MELLVLDFHTKREISIKDLNGPTITIPLKYVQCNNAKPETMLYNFTKSININDISDIDYTAGASNNNTLKPLSERFCDNIIFYYLVPIDPNNKNKVEYLFKFLAEYTSKIKRLQTEHNINVNKRYIKPTYIKVALPTIPVNDVFALITNEEGIYSLTMKVSILTISTLHKTSLELLIKKKLSNT